MPYKCFFLEPTDMERIWFRRLVYSKTSKDCSVNGYHTAKVFKEDAVREIGEDGYTKSLRLDKTDSRWPKNCECGYKFQGVDEWQMFRATLHRDIQSGEFMTLYDARTGALWYADWLKGVGGFGVGPDGHILMCKTPGGDWCIDSRASNCTMKDDNEHRCWVRHGTVPNIHVDKDGLTCQAGAGSIQCGKYHGFLHNGELTDG